MVISAGAAGKLSSSLTALVRYQQANSANQLLTNSGLADTVNLKLGLAYRNPNDDKFNALLRYEFRQNPRYHTRHNPSWKRHGFHCPSCDGGGNLRPQLALGVLQQVRDAGHQIFLGQRPSGVKLHCLGQVRATYRLGYRWDLSTEGRWIGQTGTGYKEMGLATEVGYYMTPNLRVAGGLQLRQRQRSRLWRSAQGRFYIGLQLKLNELFSGFGLQKVVPPQQQESAVQPVAVAPSSTAPPPNDKALAEIAEISEQPWWRAE